MIARWQFKRGFRSGFNDARAKTGREVAAGSWFAKGYRLGVAAYALDLELNDALAASVRGVFDQKPFPTI